MFKIDSAPGFCRTFCQAKNEKSELQFDDDDSEECQIDESVERCPDCGSDYLEMVPFFDKRFKCSECGYEWES